MHDGYIETRANQSAILTTCKVLLKDVWGYIKHDLDVGEIELTEIEKRAINGAAEMIQVAAMARKWKGSGLK